jgi:hypothetical protein
MNWPFSYGKNWKWWMRFRRAKLFIHTSGCHVDAHGNSTEGGCECLNKLGAIRRNLRLDGWEDVAVCNWGWLWWNGQILLREYHEWGR